MEINLSEQDFDGICENAFRDYLIVEPTLADSSNLWYRILVSTNQFFGRETFNELDLDPSEETWKRYLRQVVKSWGGADFDPIQLATKYVDKMMTDGHL